MRRSDREITDIDEKLAIIGKCKVCRLGLARGNEPYIVPLNFGYSFEGGVLSLFFHSGLSGKKLEIIKQNNRACFELDCDGVLLEAEKACGFSYAYKSIIGFGKIVMLETIEEKRDGLQKLMEHQTGSNKIYEFAEDEVKRVAVYKMVVDEFSGKQREAHS